MAEYTPTTEEVREWFIDGAINGAAATGFSVTLYIRNKARAEFDRWLATRDRQVRAQVLREVAPACNCEDDWALLRDRADRIEKEGS